MPDQIEVLNPFIIEGSAMNTPREMFFGTNRVHNIDSATVLKRYSLILDSSLNLIEELHGEHIFWHPSAFAFTSSPEIHEEAERRLQFLQKTVAEADFSLIADFSNIRNETIYCMHPFEWYPYGHLFDSLQRLYSLATDHKSLRNVAICSSQRVQDFATHFEFLGYSVDQLIPIPRYATGVKFNRLVVSDSPAPPSQFTSSTIEWLRDAYLANGRLTAFVESIYGRFEDDPKKPLCLFLDRSGGVKRDIINKSAFISYLHRRYPFNWKILSGSEPLMYILYLFSRADLIVGAHGAMFVNTIFAKSSSQIVEICPGNRLNLCMLNMVKECRNHTLIKHPALADHSIILEMDEIKKIFNEIIV